MVPTATPAACPAVKPSCFPPLEPSLGEVLEPGEVGSEVTDDVFAAGSEVVSGEPVSIVMFPDVAFWVVGARVVVDGLVVLERAPYRTVEVTERRWLNLAFAM